MFIGLLKVLIGFANVQKILTRASIQGPKQQEDCFWALYFSSFIKGTPNNILANESSIFIQKSF